MKWVFLFFCFVVSNVSHAQSCVGQGAWIPAGSNQRCCQGFELNPVDERTGTKGQCLKKENGRYCIGENQSILNYNGAVNECCRGLQKATPRIYDPRVAAVCVKPEAACVKEGDYAGVGPGRADCCQGLVRYVSPGRIGAAQCVKPEDNCVREEQPLFQYPGAPSCCRGLEKGRPSVYSPMGFTEVCVKPAGGSNRPGVNNSEQPKSINVDPGVQLYEDSSEVSNQ